MQRRAAQLPAAQAARLVSRRPTRCQLWDGCLRRCQHSDHIVQQLWRIPHTCRINCVIQAGTTEQNEAGGSRKTSLVCLMCAEESQCAPILYSQ